MRGLVITIFARQFLSSIRAFKVSTHWEGNLDLAFAFGSSQSKSWSSNIVLQNHKTIRKKKFLFLQPTLPFGSKLFVIYLIKTFLNKRRICALKQKKNFIWCFCFCPTVLKKNWFELNCRFHLSEFQNKRSQSSEKVVGRWKNQVFIQFF